jgi:glycosyltransferase involved in cell wall biosynthesis
MKVNHTLSLVLPAHNEEANLEPVVREAVAVLPNVFRDYEVLIVDDGSRDATPAIADRLAGELTDGHVRVVHHPRNRGYGAALASGFAAARGDLLMFMDADRQFAISEVAQLAPFVGSYDIVTGYRRRRRDPWRRVVLGASFNVLVKVLFGVRLHDIDCGFKVFRADLLRGMRLESPGALINTEIHAKANRWGARVKEVGVTHYPRPAGEQSGGSPRVVLRALGEIVALWWQLRAQPRSAPAVTPRAA